MTKNTIILKFNGTGAIPGLPAKDLTEAQAEKFGGVQFLLKTGIYEKPSRALKEPAKKGKSDS